MTRQLSHLAQGITATGGGKFTCHPGHLGGLGRLARGVLVGIKTTREIGNLPLAPLGYLVHVAGNKKRHTHWHHLTTKMTKIATLPPPHPPPGPKSLPTKMTKMTLHLATKLGT